MTTPVFRFAPSPNGELHLGHAYSALLNQELAHRMGGRVLLRIEDIDVTRTRETYVAQIFEDLDWIGFHYERPVRRQSAHMADYRLAADRLRDMGLLYPCFASRTGIAAAVVAKGADWPRDPDGQPHYPGLCRGMPETEVRRRRAAGEPIAWRIDMGAALARLGVTGRGDLTATCFDLDGGETRIAVDAALWGDAVIVRKETPTSYHLSVVVDDALQGVTHVVRGRDLEAATGLHRLLQALLGLPEPRYHHHRLLIVNGRKLAKSLSDESLRALRENGVSPADVQALIGPLG
ncbi:MAG: tRNA glutamyl-Q(34) synthetase GluQRS [Hyphomicrobiaceae bacterium]